MQNEFKFEGLVRTSPILLNSQRTGDTFVKFTIRNDPDHAKFIVQKIYREGRDKEGPLNYGQVYIDCLLRYKDKNGNVARYALENVHKGDVIRAVGAIRSGKKPVKEEGDQFRANWVYGDYLFVKVKQLEIIKRAEERRKNPYSREREYKGPNYEWSYYKGVKSADQYVSDDDIIFDI